MYVICYPNHRFGQIIINYGFASVQDDIHGT